MSTPAAQSIGTQTHTSTQSTAQRGLAVIIGVGPGIGEAVARKFASQGYTTVIVARSSGFLNTLQQSIESQGQRCIAYPCDITLESQVRDMFSQLHTAHGWTQVLVYNAATRKLRTEHIHQLKTAEFERDWRVNTLGCLYAMQAVVPRMMQHSTGTILITSATAALRARPGYATFASSKFALRALAQAAYLEYASAGIHVAHVIVDGAVDTPLIRSYAEKKIKQGVVTIPNTANKDKDHSSSETTTEVKVTSKTTCAHLKCFVVARARLLTALCLSFATFVMKAHCDSRKLPHFTYRPRVAVLRPALSTALRMDT